MKCHRRFKMQALTYCDAKFMSTRTAAGQFKGHFKGAMEEMSRKVQNANSHSLRCQSREHVHSSWSVQGSVQGGNGGHVTEGSKCELSPHHTAHTQGTRSIQRGNGGNVWEGSKCNHSQPVTPKSRARAGQPVSSRVSSRGQWRKCHRRFKMQALTRSPCAHTRHTVNSAGRWMKVQGRFKMQAHRNSVVMDVAAFKVSHSVGID